MYEIWIHNYPQADINLSEEYDMYFDSKEKAIEFAEIETKNHAGEEWRGHYLYGAKFYAKERIA